MFTRARFRAFQNDRQPESDNDASVKQNERQEINVGEDSTALINEQLNVAQLPRVPSNMLGIPLEDYDATGGNAPANDTFLVCRRGRTGVRDKVFRFNKAASVWLLKPQHPVRIFAINIVTDTYFEIFVILVILANCVFLALNNPPEEAEYIFSAVYTTEMILKIASRGFILHSFAYLRDPWNWLDFVVVILGYITLAPNTANLTGIRTFRVLRALRTISALKGLRAMVNSLLRSLRMLTDVLVLFLFFLCVMALIGLQLFSGELRHKCVLIRPEGSNISYQEYIRNESFWYYREGYPAICGNASSAGSCPANYSCLADAGPNPNHGFTHFDHIGWSMMMALQILTMDYWENLYDKVIQASGVWYLFYFVVGIFFCSFYLLNLVLAVVYLSYEQEMYSVMNETETRETAKRVSPSYPADESTIRHLRSLAAKPADETDESDKEESPVCRVPIAEQEDTSIASPCGLRVVKLRRKIQVITNHRAFNVIVIVLILMNTVVLALYHHGIDPYFEAVLDSINLAFTVAFLVEIVLRLIALGPTAYLHSKWNMFDGAVITAGFMGYFYKSAAGMSIFRILRLLRVLSLAKSWKTMARLLNAITKCVGPVSNITLILCIIIYIFAVMGNKVFADIYTEEKFGDEIPIWNFNNFWNSTMLIFRILCGEWIEPLWECMRAFNPAAAVFFFLSALIIGNFIVLNLFVALLVNAFDTGNPPGNVPETPEVKPKKELPVKNIFEKIFSTRKTRLFVSTYREHFRFYELRVLESNCEENVPGVIPLQDMTNKVPDVQTDCDEQKPSPEEGATHSNGVHKLERRVIEIDDCFPKCCTLGLGCAPSSHGSFAWLKFRCHVRCFVEHKYFDWFILVIIFISSFILIFEDVNLPNRPKLQLTLNILNYVFAGIFSMEFILKMIGLGAVKYFSSFWNCLDAFIVSISVACAFENNNLAVFRSIRTLRALRPLRAVSRLEGMKVVVNALFAAIPGIGNVVLVSMLFWLMFSILGVHFFAGHFYRCVNANGERVSADIVANKAECLENPNEYRWINAKVNFDNVLNGFLALFQVATFEGWMEVMQDATEATGIDSQPRREANVAANIYFVVFIIVGSFFVLNLFVGVIIENFNALKKKYEEINSMGMLLTDTQRKWVTMLKEAARKKPPARQIRPEDRVRRVLFDVVTGDKFEIVILTAIMCNMVTMMIQHYDQSEQVTHVLRLANYIFTGIFIVEAILKLVALRLYYFKQAWNIFDFIIVMFSVMDVVLDQINDGNNIINPSLLRVMRVFRIARLMRLVEFAKGVRQLLLALMISLPALFNIGTLLFLVLFIYSIIGMSLFSHVKKEGSLGDIINFETFGSSLMLLFRLATGSGWNDVMTDLTIQPPDCDPSSKDLPNGNCGLPVGAIFYLVSFIVTVFLIIINMYIAVILENVNRAQNVEDFGISPENFDRFYEHWSSYVPQGKHFMPLHMMCDFVADLEKPFKIAKPNEARLHQLNIPVSKGEMVHCFDLLKALVRSILEEQGESPEAFEQIALKLEAGYKGVLGRRLSKREPLTTTQRLFSRPDSVTTVVDADTSATT